MTRALAAAVLILLPALAWLQYSWLDQIADADRERRGRTLQTAASQLAQDFDSEIGTAVASLQLEASVVEQRSWRRFAERYQAWAAAAAAPGIVKAIYFVDTPPEGATRGEALPLRVWNTQTHTFEEAAWPQDLAAVRPRFLSHARSTLNLRRMILQQRAAADQHSVVLPVMRITGAERGGTASAEPPEVKLLGFQIIRLDLAALAKDVLPVLVRRHLYDRDERSDYLVAVVGREDPTRVVFESELGAAAAAVSSPEATASLLEPRAGPAMFVSRTASPERVRATRVFSGGNGHWQLVLKHRAGSLEAAVAAARTRNFLLSSGILLLLATAIGLMVVSVRRANRLARQQLEFVAAVSHELRTPVSVIGAAAGNLADGVVGEPDRVKTYGATIQSEARRLAETVERVLQLAGMAAGRGAASASIVPARVLVDEALGTMKHEIDAAGISVEMDIPDDLPSVRGDALALRSALQNLIGNAVKYGGGRGWLAISAGAIDGRRVRFSVRDRGLGIAADEHHQIFEPFYRGREAVARQIKGSGLGLHLVRRIAEAHGGSVSLESEPDRGSTFVLELPIAPDAGTAVASHAAESLPDALTTPASR